MTVNVEPITDRAQRVLTLAAQDARRRGHGSVRREHVLFLGRQLSTAPGENP